MGTLNVLFQKLRRGKSREREVRTPKQSATKGPERVKEMQFLKHERRSGAKMT